MKRSASVSLNANMTPMIDVTFLLIVFFVVVSQIVDRDVIPLDLPAPENAKAMISVTENRTVINIVPLDNGEVAGIVVGDYTIASDDMAKLSDIVKQELLRGSTEVHLRADRATKYQFVHRVIEAIRGAGGTPRLHLVVDMEERS
ncbi:biopolymer transporter ExbD [PVC group bacterium]|nr:biopolymer transporter ExbD [PVC group bacterium]